MFGRPLAADAKRTAMPMPRRSAGAFSGIVRERAPPVDALGGGGAQVCADLIGGPIARPSPAEPTVPGGQAAQPPRLSQFMQQRLFGRGGGGYEGYEEGGEDG